MNQEQLIASLRHPMRGVIMGENPTRVSTVWTPAQQTKLAQHLDMLPGILTTADFEANEEWLSQTDVIFSSWSMPLLSPAQLDKMPNLKAVFYAAGTVKTFAAPLMERNIMIVSAWAANAVPVAEYTISQIIFALKLGWQHQRQFNEHKGPRGWKALDIPGAYNTYVGLISLGMIGCKVCEMLQPLTLQKMAYDPLLPQQKFQEMGVEQADLQEIFAKCQVVSLHTPLLPTTEGMITGELLASMKQNATFINTSRGPLVNEAEMIEVMRLRPDLTTVLDVANQEPPPAGSPMYHLPNIIMTPHIAGSMGSEVLRMSDLMISEFLAWKSGREPQYSISLELMERIA